MPKELIYTSVPYGVDPGSSGYCTVAKHKGIDRLLTKALEKMSLYEMMQSDIKPVVRSYRILHLNTGNFFVLSRICYSGSDHTGRTNYLAHHLVYDESEITQLSISPAEILLSGQGWLNEWPKGAPPALFSDGEQKVVPSPRDPALAQAKLWKSITGNEALAAELPARGAWKFAGTQQDQDSTLRIISEFSALQPQGYNQNIWELTFTTFPQPSDNLEDFRIIGGLDENSERFSSLARDTLRIIPSDGYACFKAMGEVDYQPLPSTVIPVQEEYEEEVAEDFSSANNPIQPVEPSLNVPQNITTEIPRQSLPTPQPRNRNTSLPSNFGKGKGVVRQTPLPKKRSWYQSIWFFSLVGVLVLGSISAGIYFAMFLGNDEDIVESPVAQNDPIPEQEPNEPPQLPPQERPLVNQPDPVATKKTEESPTPQTSAPPKVPAKTETKSPEPTPRKFDPPISYELPYDIIKANHKPTRGEYDKITFATKITEGEAFYFWDDKNHTIAQEKTNDETSKSNAWISIQTEKFSGLSPKPHLIININPKFKSVLEFNESKLKSTKYDYAALKEIAVEKKAFDKALKDFKDLEKNTTFTSLVSQTTDPVKKRWDEDKSSGEEASEFKYKEEAVKIFESRDVGIISKIIVEYQKAVVSRKKVKNDLGHKIKSLEGFNSDYDTFVKNCGQNIKNLEEFLGGKEFKWRKVGKENDKNLIGDIAKFIVLKSANNKVKVYKDDKKLDKLISGTGKKPEDPKKEGDPFTIKEDILKEVAKQKEGNDPAKNQLFIKDYKNFISSKNIQKFNQELTEFHEAYEEFRDKKNQFGIKAKLTFNDSELPQINEWSTGFTEQNEYLLIFENLVNKWNAIRDSISNEESTEKKYASNTDTDPSLPSRPILKVFK